MAINIQLKYSKQIFNLNLNKYAKILLCNVDILSI